MEPAGTNKIIHGECSRVMRDRIPAASVDLVVTSPPYDGMRDYDGYDFNAQKIGVAIYDVLKEGGVCVWVVGDSRKGGLSLTSFEQGLMFRDVGFRVHDLMVFEKKNTPFVRRNAYVNAFELMFVLSKGEPQTFNALMCDTKRNGTETAVYDKGSDANNAKRRAVTLGERKVLTNIWAYAVGKGGTTRDRYAFEHPAMFPEQLAADHIFSWSNPGDLVLDPMCGAGTTCKAARQLGRNYIGIDMSARYCEIARRRVAESEDMLA